MEHTQAPRKKQKWSWRKILIGLVLLLVFWEILAWVAARALVVNAEIRSPDAIVVLSGSSTYVERTRKAAELYQQGRAPLVLLTDDHTQSGWSRALQRNPYFVERAREELIKQGVPADRVGIIPGFATGTHEETLLIRDYAQSQGLRSVLVVTSAYHSRRALRTLRKSFASTGTIIGLEPAPIGRRTPSPAFWWVQPEGWRSVAGEYVKLVYYWYQYS